MSKTLDAFDHLGSQMQNLLLRLATDDKSFGVAILTIASIMLVISLRKANRYDN